MKRILDSRQLLAFATLARLGSFTGAAKELFLTQSAVSHTIKALETEVGLRLFDRVGKRAHLTQAGEVLLRHAERVLREMHDGLNALEELQTWGHSRLRVGASTTACQYLLPQVLREFRQSFPTCTIRVEPGDGPSVVELLRANQIDLAVMLKPMGRDDVAFRPLFQDELRLLVSPLHPWVQQGPGARRRLTEHTFILYGKGSYTNRLVTEYFHQDGIELSNTMELGNVDAIKELVKIGLGVGVLAPWVARRELEEGSLRAFPLGPRRLRREWGVAHLRGRRLALAEETFVGLCDSVADGLRGEERSPVGGAGEN